VDIKYMEVVESLKTFVIQPNYSLWVASLIPGEIILYHILDAALRGNRKNLFAISCTWNKINSDIHIVRWSREMKSSDWRIAPLICIISRV
jgi:hypothetical protein